MKHAMFLAIVACGAVFGQTADWERGLDESRELRHSGRYLEAYRLLSKLVEHANDIGVRNETVALALNDLGGVCVAVDRYHEAKWAYEKSLRLLRAHSSETNVSDANEAKVRSALGAVYTRLGRYKQAADLLDGALLIIERTAGRRHFDYAIALNNLADVERARARFDAAEALLRRALPILEETIGPDDPRAIIVAANLAWICARLGHGMEAEKLSIRAISALETRLGPNHPLVARALYIRADVLNFAKRKAEAKVVYKRARQLTEIYREATDVRELQLESGRNN